ncbi:flagellar biosynthetic protein FliO [Rhizobium sp. TH2]|nr:flagellar biosynthetic protein FliO [Rhizobium sp. TH2]
MLDGLTPDLAPRLVLAIGGVGVAFIVLIFVLLFLKRRNSPLFIKGGKAREPRLMILDAAAVDPKRRLVLIRRDDVEHLIMIGGPTDIVIETGIADREPVAANKAEFAVRDLPVAVKAIAASVSEPVSEPKLTPVATPERRPEPAPQPVMRPAERPVSVQAEARPVIPEAKPVLPEIKPVVPEARPVVAEAGFAQPEIKLAPVQSVVPLEALPGRNQEQADRNVSAMGSMLYDEDREPMTGIKPGAQTTTAFQPIERPVVQQQEPTETSFAGPSPILRPSQSFGQQGAAQPSVATPVETRQEPAARVITADAAESALDQARARMLGTQPAITTSDQSTTDADQAKAIAARLEAARSDAMRRVHSAQPASQYNVPPVAQPFARTVTPPASPIVDDAASVASRDATPSDFEKLLEAELDASGIFGNASAPQQVKAETREAANFTGNATAPVVRTTPPITGATPDLSSEEEVARLLGEIAVNRKS